MRPTIAPLGAMNPAGAAVTLCHHPSIPATVDAAKSAASIRKASAGSSMEAIVSANTPVYQSHFSPSRTASPGTTAQNTLVHDQSVRTAKAISVPFDASRAIPAAGAGDLHHRSSVPASAPTNAAFATVISVGPSTCHHANGAVATMAAGASHARRYAPYATMAASAIKTRAGPSVNAG